MFQEVNIHMMVMQSMSFMGKKSKFSRSLDNIPLIHAAKSESFC